MNEVGRLLKRKNETEKPSWMLGLIGLVLTMTILAPVFFVFILASYLVCGYFHVSEECLSIAKEFVMWLKRLI